MPSSSQRALSLLESVDDAVERLCQRQIDIIRLSISKDKDLSTIAANTTEIAGCVSSIIRATEDLLVVTRALKEAWVLGQIRDPPVEPSSEVIEQRRKLCTDMINMFNI